MSTKFGYGVRRQRRLCGLSIGDLASRAAIPWKTLIDIEEGRHFPPLLQLGRLLQALETTLCKINEAAALEADGVRDDDED